ncbi:MAG: 5-(carboxyamino)imidazole ribonucleotide synthase [Planctomycetota bacterium]|nr:5-(carboxyamino)imidazole ribonucleotide synthase [Planctomycetota bacterium]MDA1213322.1 5-(carboxyamino)imidazole ribonucleotide synthase [Planctomycetota bacterium]
MSAVIPPGKSLGVLGSGQLGRMFAIAARRLGYRVHVFSPEWDTPTGQVADVEVQGSYDDLAAIAKFAQSVDVLTFEFENVPSATTEAAAKWTPVRPDGAILHLTQHRLREKSALAGIGLPVTPFYPVHNFNELLSGLQKLGTPAVLKTASWGYDGKGQARIDSIDAAQTAWESLHTDEAILEAFIDFSCEISVVAARSTQGDFVAYGPVENSHRRHILDISRCPANVDESVAREAIEIARAICEQWNVVGVLCVEFFVAQDGKLLINELAPRPHNSGHLTIDAHVTCQFEQQVRAICGLPLGSSRQLQPAAMANLLGDLWQPAVPDWEAVCRYREVKLHLYGKQEARPGRKMGHLTARASTVQEAEQLVVSARQALQQGQSSSD